MAALMIFAHVDNDDSDVDESNVDSVSPATLIRLAETFVQAEVEEEGEKNEDKEKDEDKVVNKIDMADWRFLSIGMLHRYFATRLKSLWTKARLVIQSSSSSSSSVSSGAATMGATPPSAFHFNLRQFLKDQEEAGKMESAEDSGKPLPMITLTFSSSTSSISSLRLHRSTFANLSPAFAAMMSSESSFQFVEASAGRVHFPNISATDFVLFLRLINHNNDNINSYETDVYNNDGDGGKNIAWMLGKNVCPACLKERAVGEGISSNDNDEWDEKMSASLCSTYLQLICCCHSRKSCNDDEKKKDYDNHIDEFHRSDEVLHSLLSVLQFAHQYLLMVEGGGDTYKDDDFLTRIILLLSHIIIDQYRFVRLSMISEIVDTLQLVLDIDGEEMKQQQQAEVSGDARRRKRISQYCLFSSLTGKARISDVVAKTKTLISLCKFILLNLVEPTCYGS